ncbi:MULTISPECIES: MFS transporter [Pseudomonas]|uniref:MFS transporter n=1 Tax=Pseudomonas TaxID=286 RepID=UPI001B33670B|nr:MULTISPECIES: MFS transporter [Pseudomonas]MBP5966869.1 MFS transporter [Pseudomonas iridis]UHC84336.1 MFS transporter [Pseudomonas sp. NIBR-H-19]
MHDISSAARNGAIRWFGAGLLCALLAEQTVLFAVPLMIFQLTGNVRYSGVAFALEWLPALIAYPFAGLLADRFGGRLLFRGANTARGLSLAVTLGICWYQPQWMIWALIGNGIVLSVLMAPVRMAVEKSVPLIAGPERLAHCQSLVQNMELLAMALGPALAAGLAMYADKRWLLGLAAVALFAAALFWRGLPTARSVSRPTSVFKDLALGWRLLLGNPPVLSLAGLNFSINLAFAAVLSANAFVISGVFSAADGVFGLMNAGAGALGLLNFILVPRLLARMSIYRLGALGFALLCLGLICMGVASSVLLYALSFLLAMAGCALFNVFNRTQRIKAIESAHLGKVMGPFYLVNLLSYPLGGLLTASVGHVYGVQVLILVLALVLTVPGTLLFILTTRRFRLALEGPSLAMEASQ